jgi:hypothetical protein
MPTSPLKGVAALLLFVFAMNSFAQHHHREATGYGGLRAGYIELEDVDEDGSYNFGLFGGAFFAEHFAVEGAIDFQTSEITLYENEYGDTVSIPLLERETLAYQLGLTFSPFRGPFRPFLLGGVGYYSSRYVLPDYYGDHERIGDGGYYGGFGLDLFGRGHAARGFTLTWDNRWLFTKKQYVAEREIKSDGFFSSLGLKFKF